MTSVEKRRSGRKSGVHRKHSDGGYSDTSSGGSFLDETDREVSNLTDRAFRSLCIGDEAVYNDADLCSSSPCTQRERQLAFSQRGLARDIEDKEELKRAAHESFSFRVQQYGQDWIQGGMYGAEIHRDPQWEVYGQRTQGRVSATFQHSFVETSQQEKSLREEHLSFLSNGATELSLQQRRSHSRVSSLIKAFNSEGHRDSTGVDGKLREWNDEKSWDKSALMSIQRELSELSYEQNFNNGFSSGGPFSSQDTNVYSSEVATVAHMNSASSFMRSSHSKHSVSAQVNCNSNFFIHSEFSPFKVWRDHNRFPFQQGEVSGFVHCSEFPKWYETPMYKELSLETQPQGPYGFERGIRHQRNDMMSVVHPTPPRSTSTSTMLQKASAVEKRCESELASHYPYRKRTQSLGTNRLPSQRPLTSSPTTEMSQRVRDTISSAEALRQKIKMMTEQNMATGMVSDQHGGLCSNDYSIPSGNTAVAVAPTAVNSKSSTTPFNISHLLTPAIHVHRETETSEVPQYEVSPQPVEHPPVRAESRGASLDVRMSSYKSRATSLLFNLKDNRKRVKSTYSPTKFKGLETLEKNKQPSIQDPRDTVIDMPDFPDSDNQFAQVEECSRISAASHQCVNHYHSTGLSPATQDSDPVTAHTGQNVAYTDYHAAQIQGEMVHHSGFTGFIPENNAINNLNNGQNLHDPSFTPHKQGMIDNVESLGLDVNRLKPSYTATEMQKLNADNSQIREYVISEAHTEQNFNKTVGREFPNVDRYQQLKDNKHDYNNVSTQDRWRQTNSQDTEKLSLKAATSPWKQEITALIEKDQYAHAYQRAAVINEEANSPRDKYRRENQQSINKEVEKSELGKNYGVQASSHKTAGMVNPKTSNQLPQYAPFGTDTVGNQAINDQLQPGALTDKYALQTYYGHNEENEMKDNNLTQNYNRYTSQEYRNQHNLYSQDKTMLTQETGRRKQYTPTPKGLEMQSLWSEPKPQFQNNIQEKSLSPPDNASVCTLVNQVKDRQFVEVKAEQATAEHVKVQHTQTELAKAQPWAQVEQPRMESTRLNLEKQTGSEKVKAEKAKAELREDKRIEENKVEHINEDNKTGEQTEKPREKQLEHCRVKEVTKEPAAVSEEAGAVHMTEEEGERVKAEQAGVERLKDHKKTELLKGEQARTQQAGQLVGETFRAEQVAREQREAEPIRTGKVKAEQADAEQAKQEQVNEHQVRAEEEKTKVVELKKLKHNKAEDGIQGKAGEDSAGAGQVKGEQFTTQRRKDKEAKVEERKREQIKAEVVNAELTKMKTVQERSAKSATKLAVKNEPDKVQQVKTELAKAKAELAKIKEKMRGEQKEKDRNVIVKENNIANRGVPLGVGINKNEDYTEKDQATEVHQQKEELFVSRNRKGQADRGAEEYDRLREKYGFTNAASANINKVSTAGNHVSHNANEATAASLNKVVTVNTEKSKDEHSPTNRFSTANIKKKEMTESQYVYSESSKEFKLTSNNNLPTNVDNRAADTCIDTVKNDSFQILEKCDPVNQTDVSLQRNSDLAKPPPTERKPKSTEQNVGPAKESHFTPPKALSHKERAQTKQEILTSKIKAHAEKEISAIKEKGFAIRDGFLSKNSTKQSAGCQSTRQKQASHDISKKHASTMSSNITSKHQMETLEIQMAPVKSVSPLSSAIIPLKSATAVSQLADPSQKQVTKQPEKSLDNVLEPHTESKQMGSYMRTDEGSVENQKKGKHEANHGEDFGKQMENLVNTDHLNTRTDKTLQATALPEAESSSTMKTKKAESNEAVLVDSAPSLNLVFDQNKSPVADDNLQIMGIMVTVRKGKSSLNCGHEINSTQQINAKDKECSSSDLESHPSSVFEVCKGNTPSMEVNMAKAKDTVVQKTQHTLKEDQTNVGMNNHPENVQETSTLQIKKNIVSEDITEKRTNNQLENLSTNAKPQRVQDPLTPPLTVTEPAETQSLLYQQDMMREDENLSNKTPKETSTKATRNDKARSNTEMKNSDESKTPNTDKNTTINRKNDSNRADTETTINPDAQLSMEEDMTAVVKTIESKMKDDKSAPQLEENRPDSPAAKLFNETNPSNHLIDNKNKHASPKGPCREPNVGDINNHVDDNVHIDSIAIRVVPVVTGKDNLKMEENNLSTTVNSDVVKVNEHKQVTSSYKEKVNMLNNEFRTEDLAAASLEKNMQDSLEDKLGVQYVLSSVRKLSDSLKASNQLKNINASSVNTQAEDGKPKNVKKSEKSVDESKAQTMEEDYFQVHGLRETNNETYNSLNTGDTSDGVSKVNECPGLLPNKVAFSNESHIGGKDEMLDQSKRKTVESNLASTQHEEMKWKPLEMKDKLAQKRNNGSTEGEGNSEKLDAGQAHVRQQYRESQSSLATKERQRSRNTYTTKENEVKEKPNVKPKERVSAIPEISAIADYARLKVIVSEDRANTIQEFAPNKKEGFFPLIQTRHSRQPMFTVDPKVVSVKEKSLPNKTEASAKVNKEPKALVFPITEKEHQRTGMFKLGDKEKQDKLLLDITSNEKHVQHPLERHKSLTAQTEQVAGTQRVSQIDQSIHQPNNHAVQTASSSSVNTQRNISEGLAYLEKNSHSQETLGELHNIEECMTTQRKDEEIEKQKDINTKAKIENGRTDTLKQERLATHQEDKKPNQDSRDKLWEQKPNFRREEHQKEENMRIKHMLEESRASLAEEERRSAQREEERRAREREAIAIKIKERREKQREAERKTKQLGEERVAQKEAEMRARQQEEERRTKEAKEKMLTKLEEEKKAKLKGEEEQIKENEMRQLKHQEEERAAQEEHQKRAALEKQQEISVLDEPQRRATQERQQRRAELQEQHRRTAQEDHQKRAVQEEHQMTASQEKQQMRAALEEQQQRAAQEKQQKRAALEEQELRAALVEQQRRAALEEQQQRAAQEKQQRRAALEEQQRRGALEEQQRRAALEEQQLRAALVEQQRRAALEEQQRRAALEEQQRRAALEEQQRRAALEEQQRRAALEEQQRRAALEEQQRRAAEEEHQRKIAQETQQRRAAVEEQQIKATQEEHLRITEQEEQKTKAAQGEQQSRVAQKEHQRRAAQEEHQTRTAQEEQKMRADIKEQQRRAALIEEQRQAKYSEEKILADKEEKKRKETEAQISREEKNKQIQELNSAEQQTKEQMKERQKKEQWIRAQREEEERRIEKENISIQQNEEKQAKKERTRVFKEDHTAVKKEEKRVAQEQKLAQREDGIRAKKREQKALTAHREMEAGPEIQEQKRAGQRMDSLQYYAITSTESERKPRERQQCSPLPSQQRNNPSELESAEDSGSHPTPYRPNAPASPAPSLPRSNTSSPALGTKPLMFRVKDNTIRGSSLTRSIKPRFHKNFGEEFRVGSPMERGLERGEEEQEIARRSAVTPVHPDTGSNRLATIKESSSLYSAPLPQHRPYSRRSIALDEEDSRSVISNMSEDVESFATSATDLADVRGLYDYERPESACSFSSDLSRSLGKPPAVPPKSEKALQRAKRLTSRRIKKELSKAPADHPGGAEKLSQEVSNNPSSSSEVHSNRHAVASPHFSPPVSLAHAPTLGCNLPSSHHSAHASPHATGPVSLPVALPHAAAPVSLTVASPHATVLASNTEAPKTVAHVPSSPILHHTHHPAPLTQYHVESSYPHYPLTQRKVLQDLGSGQYYVVDVPVQVKTKTFFDPETGKYVQLNVRESGQSTSQPQPTYSQLKLQTQMQVKPQQQPLSQASPAGKPLVLYQGYHGYHQAYQPVNSMPPNRSPTTVTLHQDQQPARENHSYGCPAPEMRQNSEGHCYSPEKTPYMDTVTGREKTHGSYESFPECDTNSQLAGSAVNDNSAHSRYRPRDIISMSELEDFMEASDW